MTDDWIKRFVFYRELLRQFVRLSVTLRYRCHIGFWNTLKIISWLISPFTLCRPAYIMVYFKGNIP